tara:strand:+ start:1811 stop:4882 length:3072 start_codon:yes stop_codon:yes gene_type:complete
MASVTQTVPTYTGGISQQPDELKVPGQVNKAKNVIPDVTHGLMKRPGGRLVASLSDSAAFNIPDGSNTNTQYDPDSQTNGKWFSYYRDETEQYLGQISRTGDVRMWKCADGAPVPVVYHGGSGSSSETALKLYLNHNADDDIQSLTLNDYTYITNRATLKSDGTTTHPKTTVAMSATVEPARPAEVFIDLKKISYASQYALNLFDSTTVSEVSTATRIEVTRQYDSSNACNSSNVLSGLPTGGNRCTNAAGNNQDAYCPNVDTRIFAVNSGMSGTAADANGQSFDIDVIRSGSAIADNAAANLYFRIATIGQSVAQGGSTANPDYQCRYTTTHDLLYGGEGWEKGDYFDIWMKNARYRVTIMEASVSKVQATMNSQTGSGLIRPLPTPFDNETTITAESIIGDIRTIIETYNNGITSSETQQIGTGLYITNGSAFNASTPNKDLMNVITDSVNTVEDLPQECKHGYVVKVKNSDNDEDDYYLKFFGNNDKDGPGVWEECPEPGRKVEFDKETMPIQLVRLQDDSSGTVTGTAYAIYFKVGYPTWDNCLVGSWDSTTLKGTVPEPSFVGKKISRLVFHRNRLCMLSDENIIMSVPGNFFDFWARTAMVFSNTDPIDISCSSTYPAVIYDAVQNNSGLVLFTPNQQFLLTTDSDILNPTTVKINALATYNYNFRTNPINLGTTIGFLDNAGKYTRFFEMVNVRREGDPQLVEQSKVVNKLFEDDLNLISNSRENGVIFFSEKNQPILYGFRYFNDSEKRMQQAWFTWELQGNVQYHCVLDDSVYAVIREGSKDVLQRFDIQTESTSRTVTDDFDTADTEDDITYRIHLDNSTVIQSGSLSYSTTTKKTTFTKPNGFNSSTKQLAVYVHSTGNEVGRYSTAAVNGGNIEVDGDWTGQALVVGYLFDMEVEFPTIHVTRQQGESYRSDTRGSLVLHRVKLSLGNAGLYETLLERQGKNDYTEVYEPVYANLYNANQVAIQSESIRTIPVYDRNTNTVLTLKSTHPSPATLQSMTWEGDYTSKYYQRV